MSPTTLQGVQSTFSIVLFSLVAVWYIAPALRRLAVEDALVPLFLVHALRYLPSSAFAPGQIDSRVPADAMKIIANGDLISAVLALAAALFLHYRWNGALAVAWIVNVVTTIDWLYAGFVASSHKLTTYPMGGNWYIMNYYAPVLGVVHVMIFAYLLKARTSHAARRTAVA
jgi:hypothetical protein